MILEKEFNTGLTDHEIGMIVSVLGKYSSIESARIFGSRAKGINKPCSDIDLALYGKIDFFTHAAVFDELQEELPLPYNFDVVKFDTITNDELKTHISRCGITIYSSK